MKYSLMYFAIITLIFFTSHRLQVFGQEKRVRVTSSQDTLLAKYDKSEKVFTKLQIDSIISYFHRRMIGDAIVEKDYVRYQFNAKTGKLIDSTKKWREDLPESITPVYTPAQAESFVKDTVITSKLYIISPESQVFDIKPVPKNPCWVVWSRADGRITITIIDAITGVILGYGVPPPFQGFAFHCSDEDGWKKWRDNADEWFEQEMGYTIRRRTCACDNTVQNRIQSDDIAIFYEISHGSSGSVHQRCPDGCSTLTAHEVETWISDYSNIPFVFLASCEVMCIQTDGSMSFEFRKGSNVDIVIVGYCGMSTNNNCLSDCWPDALDWQDELFSRMARGQSVGYAFSRANLAFPDCGGTNNCMRFVGDRNLVFGGSTFPKVKRGFCGEINDVVTPIFRISPIHSFKNLVNTRSHYIRCNSNVPSNQTLTIKTSSTLPFNEVVFLNNSKLTAYGRLAVSGLHGEITFVGEQHRKWGVKFEGGQMSIIRGGEIKVFE